jgi:Protein of unknown function (DUF2917)
MSFAAISGAFDTVQCIGAKTRVVRDNCALLVTCIGVIMNIKLNRVNLRLEVNQILPIREAYQVKVICEEGNLWITQDHDQRDVILEPGQSFTMNRKSPALVSAMVPSVLVLEEPAPAAQRGFWLGLVSMLSGWARRASQSVPRLAQHPAMDLRCY